MAKLSNLAPDQTQPRERCIDARGDKWHSSGDTNGRSVTAPSQQGTAETRNLSMVRFVAPAPEPVLKYEAFYVANIDRLTRSLTATLGSRSAAQDAAQEAMVKAYRRWDTVSTYANPMGWCYRVALRHGQRTWRKFGKEQLTDKFVATASTDRDEGLRPELVDALLALPLSQRSVIVLRVLMGWTIEETADALEISTGTVSGRYKRGMDTLRRSVAVTNSEDRDFGGGAA